MNCKALFSLIFSLSFLTVQAQNIKLTGKVVNDKNESLSDVSINAISELTVSLLAVDLALTTTLFKSLLAVCKTIFSSFRCPAVISTSICFAA